MCTRFVSMALEATAASYTLNGTIRFPMLNKRLMTNCITFTALFELTEINHDILYILICFNSLLLEEVTL